MGDKVVELELIEDSPSKPFRKKNAPLVEQKVQPSSDNSDFVTKKDLEGMFDTLTKQLSPESALSPEVRSVVKAVEDVQGLKNALKDPVSVGIEQSMATLTTGILDRALGSMTNQGQAPPSNKPLLHSVAEIFTHNVSSQLPQVLATVKDILGEERVQKGYDTGLQYIENQQMKSAQNNLPNVVINLDENNREHVVWYAQQMGFTDIGVAQTELLKHKMILRQEIEEYQRVQQQAHQQQEQVQQEQVQQEQVQQEQVQQESGQVIIEQIPQEQVQQEQVVQGQVQQGQVVQEEPIIETGFVQGVTDAVQVTQEGKTNNKLEKETTVDINENEIDKILDDMKDTNEEDQGNIIFNNARS